MSFGNHIDTISTKSRNHFTGSLKVQTVPHCYSCTSTMIKPHLQYASPVWSAFIHKEVRVIEDVEKRAMRVITKRWDMGYWDLLNTVKYSQISSLESRRLHTSMSTMYKIVHDVCYFPPDVIQQRPNFCQWTNTDNFSIRHLLALMPFTNHFYFMLRIMELSS